MPEGSYWKRARFSRRSALRYATVGAGGLLGAALVGCGGGSSASPTAGTGGAGATQASGGTSTGGGGGVPKDVKRAPGADPKFGDTPVNAKDVKQGGTYTFYKTDTTRQQDPDISIAGSDHEFLNDRLFYANGFTMELTPDLLASYEPKSPLETILHLRPGVKTIARAPVNGRVFTAEDVAYSINRKAGILDPKAAEKYARRSQFEGLTKAEAVDDVTVRLVMEKPNGALLAAFADPRAQMIPKEQDSIGYSDPVKFVGTGAWIETDFVQGNKQVFKANPDYYRKWDEGGKPGIDSVEIIVIGDRSSALAAFISGQLSTLAGVQPHEEPQIKASRKDAQWFTQPSSTWDHWAVNLKNPLFQDDRVRQAMQLSIDYKALGDGAGPGWLYSGPLHSMFPEALTSDEVKALPGYNPDTKEKDQADAAKLMAAAGFPDGAGMKFNTIMTQSAGRTFDNGVRIKDTWSKVFPKLEMQLTPVTDYGSFTNLLNTKQFETRSYNHTMVPNATLDGRTYYYSTGGRNYQSFNKPWADEALDKMMQAQTMEERKQVIRPFQLQYIKEGPPLLQLYVPHDVNVFQANFAGMDLVAGTWAYGLQTYGVGERWYWQTA